MSIAVDVGLLSGKTVSVEAGLDESVATLKRRAQTALAVGNGRLLDSSSRWLDEYQTVKKAKIESGILLTLQVGTVQVSSNDCAFAAILHNGTVVTWGSAENGGDCRAVQDQLKGVQQIQATWSAFAAILDNGTVVTWGSEENGGDSRAVQDQLQCVQQIQAFRGAFAAILDRGSVVTWGNKYYGGDSRAVQDQLKGVRAADPSLWTCFCSYPERRIGCYLGRRTVWWRQLCCARSAERSAADPIL